MKTLAGLTILITRPAPSGPALAEEIKAYGAEPVLFPTIVIEKIANEEIKTANTSDWLIFTSPQAVLHSPEISKNQRIAAIGNGTAAALKQKGYKDILVPDRWSSEGLLALNEFQNVQGSKISIITGQNGRALLAQELKHRGATVTIFPVYKRTLPPLPPQQILSLIDNQKIDIIVTSSKEGLQNLQTLLGAQWPKIQEIPTIVISQQMKTFAKTLKLKNILVAKNASHAAIINTCTVER